MKFKSIPLVLLAIVVMAEPARSEQPIAQLTPVPDWSKISKQLEDMRESDQVTRKKISSLLKQPPSKQLEDSMGEMAMLRNKLARDDAANLAQLKEIVSHYGWPRKSAVGAKAAMGAFLVLQHADPQYQMETVQLVREAVAAGEAEKSALALLEDRILVHQNQPQMYGSQVSSTGAVVRLNPVKDVANLDKLRTEMGLEPICIYLMRFAAPNGVIEHAACQRK